MVLFTCTSLVEYLHHCTFNILTCQSYCSLFILIIVQFLHVGLFLFFLSYRLLQGQPQPCPKEEPKRKRKIRQELDPLHQKYALRYIVGILSFFSTCTCTVYLPLNDGHEHNFLYLSFIILLSLSLPLSPSLSLSLSLPPSLSLFLSALWLQS